MQKNWTKHNLHNSNVSQERVEAIMAEFGCYHSAEEAERQTALEPATPRRPLETAFLWPLPDLDELRAPLVLG